MISSGTFQIYAKALVNLFKANIDFDTATFKVLLANSSYTPDVDADEFLAAVFTSGDEVTGTNWSAGGQTVTATVSIDTANDEVEVEFSDVSVATVTLTDGKYAILYNSTPGSDATNHLIGYVTFDTALAPDAGTLAIPFPAPTLSIGY